MAEIRYTLECDDIDWTGMKEALEADNFDNGRTPAQLERSFRNSAVPVIALAGERIISTARALSDGVCNAYVVDVWTDSAFRWQGVARTMITCYLSNCPVSMSFCGRTTPRSSTSASALTCATV